MAVAGRGGLAAHTFVLVVTSERKAGENYSCFASLRAVDELVCQCSEVAPCIFPASLQFPACCRPPGLLQLLCHAASLHRLEVRVLPQSQLPLSTAKGFRATLCFPHQTLPVAVCLFCFVCLNKVIIQSLPLEMIHLLYFLRAV